MSHSFMQNFLAENIRPEDVNAFLKPELQGFSEYVFQPIYFYEKLWK